MTLHEGRFANATVSDENELELLFFVVFSYLNMHQRFFSNACRETNRNQRVLTVGVVSAICLEFWRGMVLETDDSFLFLTGTI